MTHSRICSVALISALTCTLALLAPELSAQVVGNGSGINQLPNGGMLPLGGMNQGLPGQNLTPQQLQQMMLMRAMQSRGRHGVQTGIPQSLPFGSSGFGAPPVQFPSEDQASTSQRSSSSQKRAEARKVREDQKKTDREQGKAKKGKAVKQVAKDAKDDDAKKVAKKKAAK